MGVALDPAANPHLTEEELTSTIPSGSPAVLLNTRGDAGGHPGVRLDNEAGARAVAEHLLAIGRRRMLHIAGPEGNMDAQERASSFERAATAAGASEGAQASTTTRSTDAAPAGAQERWATLAA